MIRASAHRGYDMPDITMCAGGGCPYREFCYRFMAESSARQSWFAKTPWYTVDNLMKCDYLWDMRKEVKDEIQSRG